MGPKVLPTTQHNLTISEHFSTWEPDTLSPYPPQSATPAGPPGLV